ncbi:Hypothetical protein PHPALM_5310, partial [Phytophthora palmivora]
MSKKQDTLWTAFGRQRQPPAKRQKVQTLKENEVSVPRRKQRDHLEDVDAGTLTDADLLSSQEDAQSAETQSNIHNFNKLTSGYVVSKVNLLGHSRVQKTQETHELKLTERKEIKDSVHGLMTFEPVCMRIIDTLQFQRLRNLHQLGAANFVYIGATHSRFEHCLGVAYFAEKMIESI